MFNPFGNSGLILAANLGSVQSAFHPIRSPLCMPLSPTQPRPLTVSASTSPILVEPKILPIYQSVTPPSCDGTPAMRYSPSSSISFYSTPKRSPQSTCSDGTPNQSLGLCQICSDRATGKHYGANSCDGCKGFFRRTVRKGQHYACRFDRRCVIDKDKRNTCRYCRFKKCLNAGMRSDAVQNERDRISNKIITNHISTKSRDSSTDEEIQIPKLEAQQLRNTSNYYLNLVEQAENNYSSHSRNGSTNSNTMCVLLPTRSAHFRSTPSRLATVNDLAVSMKQQLLLLVEWAKSFPPFYDLNLDDQIALLRAYAAEYLCFGVARRSLPYKDLLLLSNNACIPRSHCSEIHDVNRVAFRILDELVEPMRDLQLDDMEFGCLKTVMFFNPTRSALGVDARAKVKQTRQKFLVAFNDYVTRKEMLDRVRFGNLLMLLPPLQAMSQQFLENMQLISLFGVTRLDKLLEELLLGAVEPFVEPFLAEGITAVASKIAEGWTNNVDSNVETDKKLA